LRAARLGLRTGGGTTRQLPAPIYDGIGRVYSRHRRSDPRIATQLRRALGTARTVLDVGAGTGSYEPRDRRVVAVEPSPVMAAQRPADAAPVVRAVAERLPFADASFDASMAVLTIHHWNDEVAGLREMGRVARRVVVLTFDAVVHEKFWLFTDYVPEVCALPLSRPLQPEAVADVLGAQRIETVPVPANCVDGFNWAFWSRPEAYLDPEVRACMSGLATLPAPLVAERMERLRRDLADGTWEARHGALRRLDTIDGGFRLVVRS
jgi:SAM-dependent methyltransferase